MIRWRLCLLALLGLLCGSAQAAFVTHLGVTFGTYANCYEAYNLFFVPSANSLQDSMDCSPEGDVRHHETELLADAGLLQARVRGTVSGSGPFDPFVDPYAVAIVGSVAAFGDTVTPVSLSGSTGTVDVRITYHLEASLSSTSPTIPPGCTDASATLSFAIAGGDPTLSLDRCSGTSLLEQSLVTTWALGVPRDISAGLHVNANARGRGSVAETDAGHTAWITLVPLSDDVQLVALSGHDYGVVPTAVPEPATAGMLAAGLALVLVGARRRG